MYGEDAALLMINCDNSWLSGSASYFQNPGRRVPLLDSLQALRESVTAVRGKEGFPDLADPCLAFSQRVVCFLLYVILPGWYVFTFVFFFKIKRPFLVLVPRPQETEGEAYSLCQFLLWKSGQLPGRAKGENGFTDFQDVEVLGQWMRICVNASQSTEGGGGLTPGATTGRVA